MAGEIVFRKKNSLGEEVPFQNGGSKSFKKNCSAEKNQDSISLACNDWRL